jgi:hypothetical protein
MLPRVTFNVEVTLECAEQIPGPFHEYAERQLGVRPTITVPGKSWQIKGIRVIPMASPDERRIFTLNAAGEYGGLLLSLTPEGFLAGVGRASGPDFEPCPIEYTASPGRPETNIEYVRFGIESTLKEVLDSNFSTIEVEGVPRRVWDPIERHVLKEKEDYVQEITNEIFAIRRKRLDALASPGGLSRASVEELKALEEAYLSLFLGKRELREVVCVFPYTPERTSESTPLFRFSERQGITGRDDVSAMPFLVEIVNAVVPGEKPAEAAAPRQGLTYCVPAVADLRVFKGENVLFEGRCVVPQLGYLKQIPLEVIGNEGLSIEFYPRYGSIKSLTKSR